MRRADRLFQIVQLIRGRRLSTAAFLAERLEVSQRTIYRDVADLQHQGVPIEGEAGVGYRLGAGFELPPLMFSQGEANALVAAARLAQVWLDPGLAREVEGALGKILSVLPPAGHGTIRLTGLDGNCCACAVSASSSAAAQGFSGKGRTAEGMGQAPKRVTSEKRGNRADARSLSDCRTGAEK